RRCASVIGAALDGDAEAVEAGDRVDDAERQFLIEQDAALLDVQLDEGVEVGANRVRVALGCKAHLAHCLPDRDAVQVGQVVQFGGIDLPEYAARTPEVGVK